MSLYTLAGILPLFSLLALILFSWEIMVKPRPERDWRLAVLLGSVAAGIWLTLTTEALSLFEQLQFSTVVGAWTLPVLLWLWLLPRLPGLFKEIRIPDFTWFARFCIASIIVILAITGFVAVFSPPNNWDSMTYHLSRVMHWVQNRSVAHYATHELRQLYQNPWAEYAVAHLSILSGSDYLVNLVQWLSMLGCVLGTSLIAGQMGINSRGQLLAALATATLPMGLLQAVTTQNDYVVSFWLVCFVAFILSASSSSSGVYTAGIAGSLGLALLTKATAYLFAAPFFIWFAWQTWKSRGGQGWRPVLIIGVTVLLINSGHYYRNVQLFGSPFSPALGEFEYHNEVVGPVVLFSNVVRNAALHINVLPPGPRTLLQEGIQALHQLLGLEVNDPRTTWTGASFGVNPFSIDENISGNFVHFLLILTGSAMLVWPRRHQKVSQLASHALLITVGFLLFSGYLKWQPWHSRLHLPLFVLGTPIIGWFSERLPSRPWLATGLAVLLIGQAFPFILANPHHRIIGQPNIYSQTRVEQYFIARPMLAEPYQAAAAQIIERSCDRVGLMLPVDSWEYPFWILLQQPSAAHPIRIQAVDVQNPSARLQPSQFKPCAIICMSCLETFRASYTARFGPPVLAYGQNLLFIDMLNGRADQ